MGWWQLPEADSVHLGDEAFDITYQYLDDLSALYAGAFGRKITVEELRALWSMALQIYGPKVLNEFEAKEVVSVAIKTAKRKKRQPFKVGDVFAIPLEEGLYGFGRILNLEGSWEVVEIFAYVSRFPRYSPDIVDAGRLLPPVTVDVRAFEDWKWKVIHSEPGFVSGDLDSLRYVIGLPGHFQVVKVNSYAPLGPISDAEAAKLPHKVFCTLETTVDKIKAALQKRKLIGRH